MCSVLLSIWVVRKRRKTLQKKLTFFLNISLAEAKRLCGVLEFANSHEIHSPFAPAGPPLRFGIRAKRRCTT